MHAFITMSAILPPMWCIIKNVESFLKWKVWDRNLVIRHPPEFIQVTYRTSGPQTGLDMILDAEASLSLSIRWHYNEQHDHQIVKKKVKGKGGPIAYWPLGRRTVRGSPCLGHSIWKAEPIPLLPLPFLPWIKSGTHLTAGWTEGVFQPLARVGFEPATFCFAVECSNYSATRRASTSDCRDLQIYSHNINSWNDIVSV